jgi:peptidoglycan biosynthesis protein MviN/MurJ (putative lipid II flippase)
MGNKPVIIFSRKDHEGRLVGRIKRALSETGTGILFSIPFLSGILVSAVSSNIERKLYPGGTPEIVNFAITGLILFLWGLSGFAFILRKELPPTRFSSVEGTPAVLFGAFWVIFWWGLSFVGVWKALEIIIR